MSIKPEPVHYHPKLSIRKAHGQKFYPQDVIRECNAKRQWMSCTPSSFEISLALVSLLSWMSVVSTYQTTSFGLFIIPDTSVDKLQQL